MILSPQHRSTANVAEGSQTRARFCGRSREHRAGPPAHARVGLLGGFRLLPLERVHHCAQLLFRLLRASFELDALRGEARRRILLELPGVLGKLGAHLIALPLDEAAPDLPEKSPIRGEVLNGFLDYASAHDLS